MHYSRFFLLSFFILSDILVFAGKPVKKIEQDTTCRDYASNVTIVRDEWGMPHIYGKTDADVAYGLAWASCEDHYQIVQETVLGAKGLLGLVKGKDGAVIDFFHHAIGTEKLIDERFAQYSPEFVSYLEGFAAGLNDFAQANPDKVLLRKLFPLTAKDIARAYFVSLAFNSGVHGEIKKIMDGKFDPVEPTGSNAMAFASKITTDGNTMLCINPHQPMEGHFSWYEAHLVSEEGLDIIGALFPGGTSIYVGANRHLGWAHTSNGLNAVDVYRLEMNPENELQYKFDGQWLTLEERDVKLTVKLKKWLFKLPVKKTTFWSVHGPVIKSKNNGYYAIRYPAAMEVRAPEQWYRMNKATDFNQFMAAVNMNAMPKFHIIYADKDDNIYFIDNGMIPVRDTTLDWTGVMDGSTSATMWTEWHGTENLPQLLNPDCGYVYNMNNTPYDATCDYGNIIPTHHENMGLTKFNTNRSLRFMELMEEISSVSFDDMKRMKYDAQFPKNSPLLASLGNLYNLDEKKYADVAELIALVKNWDRKATPDCVPCSAILVMFDYIFKKKNFGFEPFAEGMDVEEALYVEALRHTKQHLQKHFGKTNVTLAEMQRLRRGSVDMPMPGFPDALAAAYGKLDKDGRFKGWIGDSYTMFVSFNKHGVVKIESLHPYGSSGQPDSPHYTDQMELYLKQQPKPLTLDRTEIFRNAKKIYHPNNVASPSLGAL